MATSITSLVLVVLCISIFCSASGKIHHHKFTVESSYQSRLCSSKEILTVNGEFPGPTLKARRGDTMIIQVYNKATYNITIHWHGLKQKRNPWSDGPEYITQCPIQPGNKYTYRVEISEEEGTVWWHAHTYGWARATLHGAIIIYPKLGSHYPFPNPQAEFPIILGEWWKTNVMEIPGKANLTGGEPLISDALTINGQPGYFYPCSKKGTSKMVVEQGKRYLLRIINAIMDENMFFGIANHKLTVVGKDGYYMKPFTTDYLMITAGQSMDVLVEANQSQGNYFIAARAYADAFGAGFDKTIPTALLQYKSSSNHSSSSTLMSSLPNLPPYNRTQAATDFTNQFRSLAQAKVALEVDTHLLYTISVNLLNCSIEKPCTGPFGKRFASSVNNISFVTPKLDILEAYYYGIDGVFEQDFPRKPPHEFNYTGDNLPENLLTPSFGTKVLVLDYNSSVELVLQGTNVLASDTHPVHLHGYSFYVVGKGFGNFDPNKDPFKYNLVDPPQETTVGVPKNGWAAIRFRADNPGVWLLHCHIERHISWGMSTVFIVKNGPTPQSRIFSPPNDLPPC